MSNSIPLSLAIGVCLNLAGVSAHGESFLADFEDSTAYPIGWHIRDTGLWWGQSGTSDDPTIGSGVGVAGSVGTTAAARNYHWIQHPFKWTDPTVAAITIQMDYRSPTDSTTSGYPFSSDRMGWTINQYGTSNSEFLQVELGSTDSTTGYAAIKCRWYNANGDETGTDIVQYQGSLITVSTFYRFTAKFTKLTGTSAKIDVTLTAINSDGTLGSEIASGSIADTSLLATDVIPSPALFTAAQMWPTFRNYNGKAKGPADNAYLEITYIDAPACYSAISPDEYTVNSAEADINATPSPASFDYTVRNLGLNSFSYTVTELNDQHQPADVSWLSTDKSSGTVAAQTTDVVKANLNTTGLSGGTYTAYLQFTDSCNPAVSHVAQIILSVYGCRWELNSCNQERSYSLDYPTVIPEDFVYRLTNTGNYPLNYSVVKTADSENTCFEWLTVTNPTGTVAVGQYVDVIGHIDVNALAGHGTDTDYNCILTFSDDCSPQVISRQVRLRYLGVGQTQVFEYDGDVDPAADNSAGTGRKFSLYDSDANGSVEDDGDAIDGKVWRMVDQFGAYKSVYRAYYWKDDSSWDNMDIHGEGGSTMVARLKVNSWSGTDRQAWISIQDGDTSSATFHWGGSDGVAAETKRDIEEQTGRGTSGFVTLWVASNGDQAGTEWKCGRNVDMYILDDNQQILWEKHITSASAESSTRAGFFFGDTATSAGMDVSYDWITGTNAGAFAPGEEVAVLGRSLIVTDRACVIPFPDADQDSDVDMADFAVFQRCYSPTVEVTEDCRCFDRDGSGNIDDVDFQAFAACAGGAGVAFDPANPPANCEP
jgi:hypothetical protein